MNKSEFHVGENLEMAANNRGAMRPQSRSPPFLAIGLFVALCILGFNYWSLSVRNGELQNEIHNEISRMESELRLVNAKKLSVEQRCETTQEKLAELEGYLAKEKTENAKNVAKVAELEQKVSGFEREYATANEEKNACQNSLTACQESTTKLEEELKVVKEKPTGCDDQACASFVAQARETALKDVEDTAGLVAIEIMAKNGKDVGSYKDKVNKVSAGGELKAQVPGGPIQPDGQLAMKEMLQGQVQTQNQPPVGQSQNLMPQGQGQNQSPMVNGQNIQNQIPQVPNVQNLIQHLENGQTQNRVPQDGLIPQPQGQGQSDPSQAQLGQGQTGFKNEARQSQDQIDTIQNQAGQNEIPQGLGQIAGENRNLNLNVEKQVDEKRNWIGHEHDIPVQNAQAPIEVGNRPRKVFTTRSTNRLPRVERMTTKQKVVAITTTTTNPAPRHNEESKNLKFEDDEKRPDDYDDDDVDYQDDDEEDQDEDNQLDGDLPYDDDNEGEVKKADDNIDQMAQNMDRN